ncbi:MAG: tetratricopeptide repeat protein [Candidatus Omnitrophota bacterium]
MTGGGFFISGEIMKEYINWHETAEIYNKAEMYEEAIACYDRAIELNPLDDVAWFHKGYACFLLDRTVEELHCYNKALAINPKNIDALENKGEYLLRMNRDQEAMVCFDEVIKITERNVCSLFNRGMILKKKGKYWDSLLSFDKGLELCPDDEDALRCVDEVLRKLVELES